MNSLYLIDNGLREAADAFVEYAEALGVRPTIFHCYEDFLFFWSVRSQVEPETPGLLYPDYADWIRLAHAVIHLHPNRRGYHTGLSEGHLHRVNTSYHIMGKPVSPERVGEILRNLLGPGLDGESLRRHQEERFKDNFRWVLCERYTAWSDKQERLGVHKPPKGEPMGDENVKARLKQFFNHCPFCHGPKIRVKYWQSPDETWKDLAGRAGYDVNCGTCGEDLHFELNAMS